MNQISSMDVGWIAGIIEGEGSLNVTKVGVARVVVQMSDEDVVRALHTKTGIGNVNGPYPGGGTNSLPHYKDQWSWTVSKRDDLRSLLNVIIPLLYSRRYKMALECLAAMNRLDLAAERKNLHQNASSNHHKKIIKE